MIADPRHKPYKFSCRDENLAGAFRGIQGHSGAHPIAEPATSKGLRSRDSSGTW
jgi:hypothetical protein